MTTAFESSHDAAALGVLTADGDLRISVIVDAWNRLIVDGETTSPGRRWGSAQALRLTVAQSSTISLKRADLRPLLRLVLGLS